MAEAGNWRLALQRRRALHLAFLAVAGAATSLAVMLRAPEAAALKPKGRRTEMTAHDFSFPALEGGTLALNRWAGKPILVANTASFCGFTPQYRDLEAVWQRYRARGLVVLGVPANDFGSQEPGSNATIKSFCELNYGVDFPLLEKQTVVGASAHPLFKWAAARTGPAGVPRWNFHKILIGRDGALVGWFPTQTPPLDSRITSAVEKALAVER